MHRFRREEIAASLIVLAIVAMAATVRARRLIIEPNAQPDPLSRASFAGIPTTMTTSVSA